MTLTAAQARRAEARERARLTREKTKATRLVRVRDLKDCRWAMKELYPKDLARIKEDIDQQAKACAKHPHLKREVTFNLGNGARYHAYKQQLAKDLTGFTFRETYVPGGTTNMGDFNAPCMVDVPGGWVLHISW